MSKIIWIFLNNKLISRDTILPFCSDVISKDPLVKIYLLFPDKLSYDLTINDSYFKRFEKNRIKFILFQKSAKSNKKFVGKFLFLLRLFRFSYLIRKNNSVIVHFNFLSQNILFKLLFGIKRKTIWIESAPFGVGDGEINADELNPNRKLRFPNIFADIIIFFKKGRVEKNYNLLTNQKIIYHRPFPNYFAFKKYLIDETSYQERNKNNFENIRKNNLSILFVLGYLGAIKVINKETSTLSLLLETLSILQNLKRNMNIILKPHIVTDIDQLNKITSRFSNLNLITTQSHIFSLLPKSDLVLCNYYSTVLAYAKALKIKTVEYTHYDKKLLSMTQNKSIRPEFVDRFFNNQPKQFKRYLNNFSKHQNKNNNLQFKNNFMPITNLVSNFF